MNYFMCSIKIIYYIYVIGTLYSSKPYRYRFSGQTGCVAHNSSNNNIIQQYCVSLQFAHCIASGIVRMRDPRKSKTELRTRRRTANDNGLSIGPGGRQRFGDDTGHRSLCWVSTVFPVG